jgi:hypothetical protein
MTCVRYKCSHHTNLDIKRKTSYVAKKDDTTFSTENDHAQESHPQLSYLPTGTIFSLRAQYRHKVLRMVKFSICKQNILSKQNGATINTAAPSADSLGAN